MKKIFFLCFILLTTSVIAQKSSDSPFKSTDISGLTWRGIGPATTSGRIADLAINPNNPNEWYIAAASGGVWKTSNHGTSFTPLFDAQGSYSIGCVTLAPSNSNVVWVGTGENNNQRSVAYGDGVYKSTDGGQTWKNMGLKTSEHIGKIIVHPTNENIVYVAAYGPLWSNGGERGLYKTIDGGKNWMAVLNCDMYTGVSDLAMDPENPDVIYASTHQRRRRVFTYISGGPGSKLFKSTNGGNTWDTLGTGFPKGDLGRIAIAVSPVNGNYVYTMVEADKSKGGIYASTNGGASFKKVNGYQSSGNYYVELIPDPVDPLKVYSVDTWGQMTTDGGKTWSRIGNKFRHVDDHAYWIDPSNTNHMLIGCDGGLYESYNREDWHFFSNLPITQFYRVSVDNSEPFYYVYGGTQDNATLGGPSRTINNAGITNADWFVTTGGDGFETVVDPVDPNIVYSQSQYGFLVRYDRKTGERIGIKPVEGENDPALRWNWDAPVIISPHNHKRLYFAANKLYKSDDQGNSWQRISGDLTRQIDRNRLPVMDKVWSIDAVAKNRSTTIYGNCVALDESPLQEGLLYVGTDDGLIQIKEGDGEWRKENSFQGVPDLTYVNDLLASKHNVNTVYAAFNNHKNGDFKPYILKSTDKGLTWSNISNNLPVRGSIYCIEEDHIDPNLLFVGTEFGVFYTVNGGGSWVQIKSGLPTVAVRDMEIQKRENDLVIASFGRGFYILDDYSALRELNKDVKDKNAHIFAIKNATLYQESVPLGWRGKSFQGESYYTAPNPEYGAVFTYYLNENIKSLKAQRQAKEKANRKNNEPNFYPTKEELRAEAEEEKPYLLFTIIDANGNIVRRLKSNKTSNGVHRINWDLRYPSTSPAQLSSNDSDNPFSSRDIGPHVAPGKYTVSLSKVVRGEKIGLTKGQAFEVESPFEHSIPVGEYAQQVKFEQEVGELKRAVNGTQRYVSDLEKQLNLMKVAIDNTANFSNAIITEINTLKAEINAIQIKLNGDNVIASKEFETAPSIGGRVGGIVYYVYNSTGMPTQTMMDSYKIASNQLKEVLSKVLEVDAKTKELYVQLENAKAPYTPGRLPVWN